MEEESARIAKFQPAMIPSQIQTAEYATELLSSGSGPQAWGASDEDIREMVAARMQRQQILYRPDRQIQVVILEAALRTRLVSLSAQAGQLDRMLALDGLPSLDLGIVPAAWLVPVFPQSGFVIFDDFMVVVETLTGEQRISDPADVARYASWFASLHGAAVRGRAASAIIRDALAALSEE